MTVTGTSSLTMQDTLEEQLGPMKAKEEHRGRAGAAGNFSSTNLGSKVPKGRWSSILFVS